MKMNLATSLLLSGLTPLALAANAVADTADNATNSQSIEKITVTGSKLSALKTETNSGALGSLSVLNTPFSVATVTAEDIEKRQVNSLDTLFSRDASVTSNGGTYSGWASNITVRGLPLDYTNSFKINGLSANNFSGEMPYEAFEQVELLKGATGFMYGFAAPGGVVNYKTKRPKADLLNFDVGFRSDSIYSAHIDAGDLFGSNDQFGVRVNGAHEEGTIYDGGSLKRDMASLAFDARLTDALLWTADVIYNQRTTHGSSSWLMINGGYDVDTPLPKAPDGDTNLAFNGAFNDQTNLIVQTALDWQFADNWHSKFEYAYTKNDTRWLKSWPMLLNSAGDLRFRYYDQYFDIDYDQVRFAVGGEFNTGSIQHKLYTGISWQKSTTDRNDPNRDVSFIDDQGDFNMFDATRPTHYSALQNELKPMWSTEQKAFFINDNIAFTPAWNLLLGARVNRYNYEVIYEGYRGRVNDYEDTQVSPTAALIFKPDADSSIYASYVESFEEGTLVDATYANADEYLPPKKSKQYEIGAKVERDVWSVDTSIFRIERAADIITSDNYYRQSGTVVYQGWEANGTYLATDNLRLNANLMLLKSEYQDTTANGVAEGNRAAGAPKRQLSLQATYDVPAIPGLSVNAGAKYYGDTAVDSANNWTLGGYTLFDAAISYTTDISGKQMIIRAASANLGNKNYWSSASDGYLRIGEPQTISLNVEVKM